MQIASAKSWGARGVLVYYSHVFALLSELVLEFYDWANGGSADVQADIR